MPSIFTIGLHRLRFHLIFYVQGELSFNVYLTNACGPNHLTCYSYNIILLSSIKGHWLGNQSSPIFTVIDTPGFGNDLVEEERTIEGKEF